MSNPENDYPATVPSCLTLDQARTMVAGFVEAFHQQDVEALAQGWTEDVVIRFADLPEIKARPRPRPGWPPASPARRTTAWSRASRP